jgi:hypothetical protein
MARQGYGNARFEVNAEEGLDLVEEFYTDEVIRSEEIQSESKTNAKPQFNQERVLYRRFSKLCRECEGCELT